MFTGTDMLRVEIRSVPPVAKLYCSGRIVLGVEAETLRCMAASRPERSLVVDLQQVHAIDAAGLGLLVELHCRALESAGDFIVANASPPLRRLMRLTNLESVLQFDDGAGFELDWDSCDRRAMTA
jgi:anti-anti-sigma factor